MKQLTRLLGIILLFSLNLDALHAQEKDLDVEVKEKMDHVFEYIDKSKIETGLLSDYGCWLIDPYTYNGTLTADNYVSMESWKMAYLGIYTSRINGNAVLKEPGQLFDGLDAKSPALLRMKYNRVDENALADGRLITVNEQLHETGKIGYALYPKRDLFAVGFPRTEYNPAVSFTFRCSIFTLLTISVLLF